MFTKLRAQLTFANVVGLLALFIALGATGAAKPVANTAGSLGSSVKKAVGLSRKADRNARKALRLAKRANENASKVKAKGGPPGPRGVKGDLGQEGAPGPSEAITDRTDAAAWHLDGHFGSTDPAGVVAGLNLRPGSYLVFAKGYSRLFSTQGADVHASLFCDLEYGNPGQKHEIEFDEWSLVNGSGNSENTVILTGPANLTEQGHVYLFCGLAAGAIGPAGAGINLLRVRLNAIKVGTLFERQNY